mmetsp:Transcript_34671/g.54151  ORF Transcript_34671/g.54151 Transcript_34671/m.54151 type:complete len:126 (-) Transcript_34671:2792-3169(-)
MEEDRPTSLALEVLGHKDISAHILHRGRTLSLRIIDLKQVARCRQLCRQLKDGLISKEEEVVRSLCCVTLLTEELEVHWSSEDAEGELAGAGEGNQWRKSRKHPNPKPQATLNQRTNSVRPCFKV